MQEHAYEELFNKYGLKNLTDWHVSELINSVRHFREASARVELFGNFLGAYEAPTATKTRYLKWGGLFFMKAVRWLSDGGVLPDDLAYREDTTILLSVKKAMALIRYVFAHIGARDLSRILGLVEALSRSSHGRSSEMLTLDDDAFDLDDVLKLMMEEWLANNTRWSKRLNIAFFRHATSYRVVLDGGGVVRARDFAFDKDEEYQEDGGYFHTLELPQWRACVAPLCDPGVDADAYFEEARKLLQSNEKRERKLRWREVVDKASGESYFYNETEGVTAWTIPESETGGVNPDVEVDRVTFCEYAKFRGMAQGGERQRGGRKKPKVRGLTHVQLISCKKFKFQISKKVKKKLLKKVYFEKNGI